MRLTRHDNPAALLALADPLLRRTEAENALLFGILTKLVSDQSLHSDPYLASLQDDAGATVAVALCTPPFVVVMTEFPRAGQALLVADLQRTGQALSGVLGAEPEVNEFAARWAEATGQTSRPTMRQRTYRLDRVRRPDVPGQPRACVAHDREQVETWTAGFVADLGLHGAEHLVPVARHTFDRGGFFLWEHRGAPRSMAALVGETPRGARIGFVYTPPDQRRQGYGAACTAAVSQHYLDAGKDFCCLNADLGNPVSNSIYQRIGYRPLGDLREILFVRERAEISSKTA